MIIMMDYYFDYIPSFIIFIVILVEIFLKKVT